jgi:DNA-binding PadR family transcriptional regulator
MMTKHDFSIPSSGIITRIALLAMLSMRPMHGYEVRQTMEARHMHKWANIQYGSIYRGLQQLTREGLLEEEGAEREGNRPTRTIYKVTPQGQEELLKLLREAWTRPHPSASPVDIALSLFMFLSQDELVHLIEKRLQMLDEIADMMGAGQANFLATQERPEGIKAMVQDLFLHRKSQLEAERQWAKYILERAKSGVYRTDDLGEFTPPCQHNST